MTHLRSALLAIGACLAIATGAQTADPLLTGIVSSASGQKLEGATVYAKREGSTITTTVHTDEDGSYYFPPLPVGKYRVSAQALGFELSTSLVELTAKHARNLVLQPITDAERRIRQLPSELLVAALPEATPDDARIKKIFMNNCTGCHPSGYALQFRFNEADWNKVITLMTHGGRLPGPNVDKIMQRNQKELAAYLARARGVGESSMKFATRPRPTGEAARAVWTLYDVPANPDSGLGTTESVHDGTDWSLGSPAKLSSMLPHDTVMGLDGNLYYTVNNRHRTATIGRVDGKTGAVTHLKVPAADGLAAFSHGMALDATGNVWFDVNPGPRHSLGKLDTMSQKITVYAPPPNMPQVERRGTTVDVDGKGMIWVSAADGVFRFDPATETFTHFKSLSPSKSNGEAYGVAGDRNGNGWWLQMVEDTIGRADVSTGKVTEVKLPPVKSELNRYGPEDRAFYDNAEVDLSSMLPWSQGARRMGVDKGGDVLWVANGLGESLARINTDTSDIRILPMPDRMQPYHIAVDRGHNVWGDLWTADQLFKLNPTTNKWTLFDLPLRGTEARHISLLERDGKVQVVVPITRTSKLGVMTVRTEAELAALKAQTR